MDDNKYYDQYLLLLIRQSEVNTILNGLAIRFNVSGLEYNKCRSLYQQAHNSIQITHFNHWVFKDFIKDEEFTFGVEDPRKKEKYNIRLILIESSELSKIKKYIQQANLFGVEVCRLFIDDSLPF